LTPKLKVPHSCKPATRVIKETMRLMMDSSHFEPESPAPQQSLTHDCQID
jgi:hypothetical protein